MAYAGVITTGVASAGERESVGGRYKVIADSFDEYLQMLMDNGYRFINEE
jgi:hypothetical protein